MLAVLPLLAFVNTFLVAQCLWPQFDWRRNFLRATVAWGVYLVFVTESLSLFRLFTETAVTAAWGLYSLISGIWLFRHIGLGRVRQLIERLAAKRTSDPIKPTQKTGEGWKPRATKLTGCGDLTLAAGVVAILGITAGVAWLTPPQTWDSLNYHLARVAHWTQDHALHNFPTGIIAQNINPPGAEMIIFHFQVLTGGDRLANFVEWFSMLGSLIGASWIARQLGARKLGQILAAVIVATIPMGIVQASSTMTDYVVAYWMVCLAAEVMALWSEAPTTSVVVFTGLAAGLGMLTKPTAIAYVIPLACAEAGLIFRRVKWKRLISWTVLAAGLVLLVISGYLLRNYTYYGNWRGNDIHVSAFGNQLVTPAGILSNLIRNVAFHTGVPWGRANRLVYETVVTIHKILGVSVEDPRTTTVGPYPWMAIRTHEDMVGNTLHGFLILVCFLITMKARKRLGRPALAFAIWVSIAFVLFSAIFKWQIFGSRYHMPFFVLFAPLLAYVLASLLPANGARLVGLVLIIACYPWLFSIDSRPLIPDPKHSYVGSVLSEPRQRLYFANALYMARPYETMTNEIKDVHCSQIGLMLGGNAAEYPLWVLLDVPRSGRRIEWIVAGVGAQATPADFRPCAIICDACGGSLTINDLPLVYDDGAYQLYLASDAKP